jgi:8-oxo-dGTP diphosphatase
MILQVGVKVLLKNPDGKFLLLHRSLQKYPETKGERWDIVGGRIEPGVPLIDNLKREVLEETGLTLIGEPRLLAAQDILKVADRHVVRLTYIGEATGNVVLGTDESDSCQWFSAEEILKLEDINFYFKELLGKGLLDKLSFL